MRFADFLKNEPNSKLPETYEDFVLMDILNLSREDIDNMGFIERLNAINYASVTYKMRNMGVPKKKGNTKGKNVSDDETVYFSHPDDFDIDPNFISDVNYKKEKGI